MPQEFLPLPQFDTLALTPLRQDSKDVSKWRATPLLKSLRANKSLFITKEGEAWNRYEEPGIRNSKAAMEYITKETKYSRIKANLIVALERRMGRGLKPDEVASLDNVTEAIEDLAIRSRLSPKGGKEHTPDKDHKPWADLDVDHALFTEVCLTRMGIEDKRPVQQIQHAFKRIQDGERAISPAPTKSEKARLAEIDGTKIYLVVGDIADPHPVDAIVNPMGPQFDRAAHPSWHSIRAKAGEDIINEANRQARFNVSNELIKRVSFKKGRNAKFEGLPIGYSVSTTAGKIKPAKEIIHTSFFYDETAPPEPNNVCQFVKGALTLANDRGLQSVAFPLIGAGQLKLSMPEALAAMLEGVRNFRESASSTVKDITIYIYPHKDTPLREQLKRYQMALATRIATNISAQKTAK